MQNATRLRPISVKMPSNEENPKQQQPEDGPFKPDAKQLEQIHKFQAALRERYKDKPQETQYDDEYYSLLQGSDAAAHANCWRFLEHVTQDQEEALRIALGALEWRHKLHAREMLDPKRTLKEVWLRSPLGFTGQTSDGHCDVLYLVGKEYKRPDSSVSKLVNEFLVHLFLSWDKRHEATLRQLVLVFDSRSTGISNVDLDTLSWLISMRDYLPARFHSIHVIGVPLLLRPFVHLALSWLSDRFKRLVHLGNFEQLTQLVPVECVPAEAEGGRAPDTWRLAPLGAAWRSEITDQVDQRSLELIFKAISPSISAQRMEQLIEMQRGHELEHSSNRAH